MKKDGIKNTQFPVSTVALCGVIIAAAVILCALTAAALAGVFSTESAENVSGGPDFSAPRTEKKDMPPMPEFIDESPSVRIRFDFCGAAVTERGLEYEVRLVSDYSGKSVSVNSLKCSVYCGAEHISDLVLADTFTMNGGTYIPVNGIGSINIPESGDISAVFYVEWQDEAGLRGYDYKYVKARRRSSSDVRP